MCAYPNGRKSAAKELMEKQLSIPSTLVTQEFLLENNVTSLRDLDEALSAMGCLTLYLPIGSKLWEGVLPCRFLPPSQSHD